MRTAVSSYGAKDNRKQVAAIGVAADVPVFTNFALIAAICDLL